MRLVLTPAAPPRLRLPRRRALAIITALALVQNYLIGWLLHYVYLRHDHGDNDHDGEIAQVGFAHHGTATVHEHAHEHELSPFAHFLRDSTLAAPVAIVTLVLAVVVARAVAERFDLAPQKPATAVLFAFVAAAAAAVASVPEVLAHGWLFDEKVEDVSMTAHVTHIALITLRYAFAITLAAALLFGVPWRHEPAVVPATAPDGKGS